MPEKSLVRATGPDSWQVVRFFLKAINYPVIGSTVFRISYPEPADKMNIQKENSLRSVHLSRKLDKLDLISLVMFKVLK